MTASNTIPPTDGQAASALPGAEVSGVFTQPIAFDPPNQVAGLVGCTGIARLGICIRCDRLYQAGDQMHPPAYRDENRVYRCASQVLDGVHVTNVAPIKGVDKTADIGGVSIATPAGRGVPK